MPNFTDDVQTSKKFISGGNGVAGGLIIKNGSNVDKVVIDGDTGLLNVGLCCLKSNPDNNFTNLKIVNPNPLGFGGLDYINLNFGGLEIFNSAGIALPNGMHAPTSITIDAKTNSINLLGINLDGIHEKATIGNVLIDGVAGDIILNNADCAEDFEISTAVQVDPGTVMAFNNDGKLVQGKQPYDKRVAGVVSGAGDLKPGLILGRQPGKTDKLPIALVGKVYCKIDADYESIEVGDLLTTSATPGYAMKASDPTRSFGAVIGKALKPLRAGCGLIPILVALQ
jgi:hypothetical protein